MTTGCPDCDRVQAQTGSVVQLCPKHTIEYLKWVYETAQQEYEAELKKQKEREQDAKL